MVFPPEFKKIKFVGDRHEFLIKLAQNKIILHVGCAQHSDNPGKNLHVGLVKVAKEAWGIDLDEEGIEQMRKMGINNLIVGNAQDVKRLLPHKKGYFDVVFVPEILEHVGCPITILTSVSFLANDNGWIVVTGPNSFGLRRFIWAFLGREAESPDHRFTFHPSGLELLCKDAGLGVVVERFSAIESSHRGGFRHKLANNLFHIVFSLKPYLADSIGLICKRKR